MFGLVSTGFSLVALVLLIAIIFAVISVDKLKQQSEQMVLHGVQLTRLSRQLSNSITAMERNARQYMVLTEPALLESYQDHQREFHQTLQLIEDLDPKIMSAAELAQMRSAGREIYNSLQSDQFDEMNKVMNPGLETFQQLRAQARELSNRADRYVENELKELQQTSIDVRAFLLLSNAALIPVALILMVLFTALIMRPIRQIEVAIKGLGEGNFEKPISISGPSVEMQALAKQLDWLRCRILQLENDKNQFLQRMSHELKTPLASIREGTDLLMDDTVGSLSIHQREIVGILHESGLELQALIENLLNFTAWKKWSSEIQLSRFDLSTLVNNVVNRHRLGIEHKELHVITPTEPLNVLADRERMRLVLDNLIANAVKFSPPKGVLTVLASLQEGQLEIIVKDEGPGIPASEHDHIFTPFYQGENSRDVPVRGTGIGLSVVRESVIAHDGNVSVADNKPSGTCFQITIPQFRETA